MLDSTKKGVRSVGLALRFTVVEKRKATLEDFLRHHHFSKKSLVALKHRGGHVAINGAFALLKAEVYEGDVVTVKFADEVVSEHLRSVVMPLDIVHEDDYLLIVNKPAGLPVMPAGVHSTSLANGILNHYEKIGLKTTVHFVNRLDRGTSGLLIVAKYKHIHHLMTLSGTTVNRKYYALVEGTVYDKDTVNAPIYRPEISSIKRKVAPQGQHAITHYEPVAHFAETTLLRCTLETGRTHQIRVHMAHICHPIVDDPLYGELKYGKEDLNEDQLLHSYAVAFTHPISGEFLIFETEVPARFGI